MILFGVRSPLVVEFEETCQRLKITLTACVSVNGTPRVLDQSKIISLEEFDRAPLVAPFIACAFEPQRRQVLIQMGLQRGLRLSTALIDPTAILAHSVRVSEGTFINAGTVIGAASIIGQGVLINRAVSLGHHTLLGDFVSIGPGSTLAGNVRVGPETMIGAGTVVLPHVRIGSGAIVGAGSLVLNDVPEGGRVAGHPATPRTFRSKNNPLDLTGPE